MSSRTTPPLRLRNGVVIEGPLGEALRFIEQDGTYQGYDAVAVDPYTLSEADLHLANRMIARMGSSERAAVLGRSDAVRAALRDIPERATLTDPEPAVPWGALRRLFAALEGLPGVGIARATKVLHKKRPALVPILDGVVAQYLEVVEGPTMGRGQAVEGAETVRSLGGPPSRRPATGLADKGIWLTRAYHRELQLALPVLVSVRDELFRRGYRLSECRLLDIYLWAYSGTYVPLWQRRPGPSADGARRTLPGKPTARAPSPGPNPPTAMVGVVSFWRDDAGYLTWLRSHPAGFVINCEHQPKARYLKLHRTICPHFNAPGVRSWTDPYMKACSDRDELLSRWCMATAGAYPDRCPRCSP
jgi:hypothetical protein